MHGNIFSYTLSLSLKGNLKLPMPYQIFNATLSPRYVEFVDGT